MLTFLLLVRLSHLRPSAVLQRESTFFQYSESPVNAHSMGKAITPTVVLNSATSSWLQLDFPIVAWDLTIGTKCQVSRGEFIIPMQPKTVGKG